MTWLSTAELQLQLFQAWERRCRGWQVFPHRVALEPAFLPFDPPVAERPYVEAEDDGRLPPLHERVLKALSGGAPKAEIVPVDPGEALFEDYAVISSPPAYPGAATLVTYRVRPGRDQVVTPTAME